MEQSYEGLVRALVFLGAMLLALLAGEPKFLRAAWEEARFLAGCIRVIAIAPFAIVAFWAFIGIVLVVEGVRSLGERRPLINRR